MIRSSKDRSPEKPNKTLSAKLFHNLCQVNLQRFAWHPPFSGEKLPFSAAVLKWIAVVTMLIDHVGAAIILYVCRHNGVKAANDLTYNILRDIGRVAFPLYIFMLVEGFSHTKSAPKYLLRLSIFALISEVPFDLAFRDKYLDLGYQNVFFTLLIGLACIFVMDRLEKTVMKLTEKGTKLTAVRLYLTFLNLGVIAAGSALAWLLKTDYSAIGVLAICVMYLWRFYPLAGSLFCCLILFLSSLREVYCLAALIPISLYNGKRGRQPRYFFYAFYPVHLLLLYLLRLLILSR
ncbi:MAG: conjugal transfer protein TraX [Lachnospiraceae bacterium]|nr:conjugal transfer protein TraX [Lachnospiraceae bacterium]